MVVIGLVMGIAGYFYSGIFGIGYKAINNILAGTELWNTVLILLLLKFILVPLILYLGGFGGTFFTVIIYWSRSRFSFCLCNCNYSFWN